MSDLRAEILEWLAEQEALCLLVTPGPWKFYRPRPGWGEITAGGRDVASTSCSDGEGSPDMPEFSNGHFIAAARTVLPLALAALRGEVEAHEPREVSSDYWICNDCSVSLDKGDVCGAIKRIHAATVGAK